MFKKLIITFFVLLLLAAIGVGIFIFTFDADRYRPYVEQKISEATGAHVQLEKISLTWKNGFALEAKNFALLALNARPGEDAPLQVKSAAVAVDALPLLRGQLQMGALLLDGVKVRVDRHADGTLGGAATLFNSAATSEVKTPGVLDANAPAPQTGSAQPLLALLISRLSVENSEFVFHDASGAAPQDFRLEKIELHLEDVSFLRPFPVKIKAAALNRNQNIEITGNIHIQPKEQKVTLENFRSTLDLASLDPDLLKEIVPDFRKNGVPSFGGTLSAELSPVVLDANSSADFQLQLHLAEGRYEDANLPLPLEKIKAEALVQNKGLDLQSLSAELGSGHFVGSGKINWSQPASLQGEFQTVLSGLDLTQVVPPANSREPSPQGILSANFKGTFTGPDSRVWTQTLNGTGAVSVKNAVIKNLNVTREIISKLSIIPGVSDKMSARLSPEYRQKLEQNDTQFAPIDIPLRIERGVLYADSVAIQAETFTVTGGLRAVLDGLISGRVFAALDPEFSAALIKSVHELQYLADRQNQLVVPFILRGPAAKPEIIPDLQDSLSRLAAGKTQELLTGMLSKKKTNQDGTAGTTTTTPSPQEKEAADPFATLLGQVLGGQQ